MITAVTQARRHGETVFHQISGQDVPLGKQLSDAKSLRQSGDANDKYAEVQVWTKTSGLVKRFKFTRPAAAQPQSKSQKSK